MPNGLTLRALIDKEELKWVKEDLIPLINLLNIGEKGENQEGGYYYRLPLSKENLIRNLIRILGNPESLILEELNAFQKEFNEFINTSDTTEMNYRYETRYSKGWHKGYKCTGKNSEVFFKLDSDMRKEFKIIDQNREFDSQEIFNQIISALSLNDTVEVKNLIYLGILKTIFKKCQFGGHYDFSEDGVNELIKLLQKANIDNEIINYCFGSMNDEIIFFILSGGDSPFKMLFKYYNYKVLPNGFDTFYENLFLPVEDKWYAIFYSHSFNLSSCYICNNIVVRKEVAKALYDEIIKIPLEKILEESYLKVKIEYKEVNEDNIPLFDYNDNLLIFLDKYMEKLKRCENFPFFKRILSPSEEDSLKVLKNEGLVEVDNGRIIAIVGQVTQLNVLYQDLKRKENERIGKNVTELFFDWIRSEVSLDIEIEPPESGKSNEKMALDTPPKTTPDDRIKPPKKPQNILPPLLKKEINILLGQDKNQENIYWIPENERNWNFVIVGTSGTGKTQTVKAILSEFKKSKIPYIIFDFRKDFILLNGAQKSDFGRILDLNNISINPLDLDVISPKDQKYQISDIINLVYNLGDLQLGIIRKAIKASYEQKGISEEDNKTWKIEPPTFTDLQINLEKLAEKADSRTKTSIEGIFARLDPIFDYKIFSAKTNLPFKEILEENIVIDLGILPNENLKAIVCEFFLRKLRYYLNSLPESIYPKFYIIIDEAHRLKYEKNSSIGQFFKEARKYGVGILLSTQDPVDFTELVYNNLGGLMSLQLNEPKYAKKISEHLGGDIKWKEIKNDLSSKFSAIVKFTSAPNAIKLKILPYFKRE